MDAAIDINLILYFLLAVLVIVVAGLLVLLYLVTRWRKQVEHALLQLGSELNTFTMQIDALRSVENEFGSLHRQPYSDLAAELQKKTQRIIQETRTLEDRWNDLNAAHHTIPINPLQSLVDTIPSAYRNARQATLMWQLRERIQRQMKEAQSLAGRIESLPEEIHSQTRQAGEGIQQMTALLKELHEAGLHGKQVEEADDALLRIQQGWARIPPEFTDDQPPDSQLGEVRETASSAYTLLNDIHPVLDEWLPRVRDWDRQYKRAVDSYESLRKTATNFRSALETPPAALNVDRFRGELEKVRSMAKALNQRLQEPLTEDLRALEKETDHLEKVVLDAAKRYDITSREVESLDRGLLELETLLKQAETRLVEPEKLQVFPLGWDLARPSLLDLHNRADNLGGRDLRRTPEQVTSALAQSARLGDEVKALIASADQALGRPREILTILGTGAVADGAAFTARVQALVREVQAYDPANWSSQDNLADLPKEAAQLEDLQRRLTAVKKPAQLKESELPARLSEARRLSELHTALRARAERIRSRQDGLHKIESAMQDELQRASATVQSLTTLLKDNPFLQETAAAELNRAAAEIDVLQKDFANPQQGLVDRKASRANTLLDGLARSENAWLDKLSADLQIHTRKMNETLAALDPIASLDDRTVVDARTLLNRIGSSPVNRKSNLSYLEAAAELKRWNNDWQACAASARALDKLAAPVLEAYRDADQARKAARAAFQSAGKLSTGRRDWPPTRQTLADDVRAFQDLEKRLDGLRNRSVSSGTLVRELGQIYHELDRLDDHVSQAARQAEAEQSEAAALESQVEELQQRWQAQAQRYPDQADLDLEIKDLVSQADQRLAQLRNQYKRGGLDYEQVMNGLREQAGILRTARFSTVDGQPVTLTQN